MRKLILLSVLSTIFLVITSFIFPEKAPVIQPAPPFKAPEFRTKFVVVLVIDGPRYTETFGNSESKYIPNMGKKMIHEGVLFTNFRNNGVTETNSGHTAIITGGYEKISNGGKELPKKPSMFQYFLKQSQADRNEAWVITSKGKLQILSNCRDKKWTNTYMPYSYCGPNGNSADYGGDINTFQRVKEVIKDHTPQLMLVNLLEADVRAHENKWEEYLQAITNCDNYALQLWNYIQENPEMKDRTALFITNDHGRHLDGHRNGFINHGDGCEGCRHISLLAMGPDFKKDVIISEEAEMIDISKTISRMLGFDMPTCKGRFLGELFN
jgi:hypothetical protein